MSEDLEKINFFQVMNNIKNKCKAVKEEWDNFPERRPKAPPFTSSFGKRYNECTFENSKKTDIIDFVKEWDGTGMLVISGVNGCGKTLAIACFERRFWDIETDRCFGHWPPKPMEFRSGFLNGVFFIIKAPELVEKFVKFPDVSTVEYQIKNSPIMVIDDMGTENLTDYALTKLHWTIDVRYANDKPLIITTHLSAQKFTERYKEARGFIDRLREWGIFFESKQKSFRVEKGHLRVVI